MYPAADLPPIDFVLTPFERSQAALGAVELERQRIERNREDQRRQASATPSAGQGASP